MGQDSKIEWTDHSFSPWIGCTEVSPGCDNCYAREMAKRYGWAEWGAGKPRHRTSAITWRNPIKWNAAATKEDARARVFPSLCDPFDNDVPDGWLCDFLELIDRTPNLDWLLLTKRIGNAAKCGAIHYQSGWPKNVWLGISVVNQDEADRDIPKLLSVPARVRFLSCEPLLGPIALDHSWMNGLWWVIVGGESGPGARPMNPQWARDLRDQCREFNIPFFFKQWGEWASVSDVEGPGVHFHFPDGRTVRRTGKKLAGRLLDGREWSEFPQVTQQHPISQLKTTGQGT